MGMLHERGRRISGLAALITILCASSAFAGVNRWTSSGPNAATIANLTISPAEPAILYLATGSALFQSRDAGASWDALTKPDGWISSIQVESASPSSLYAVAAGIYRSDDGGATWTKRSPIAGSPPVSLSLDSSNPPNLYAAADGIYKSTNGGVNWMRIAPETQFGVNAFGGYLQNVVCHPANSSVVFVTAYAGNSTGAEAWQSKDSGASWNRMNLTSGPANARYNVFAVYGDPNSGNTAYAVADIGLFQTTDGGTSWVKRYSGPMGYNSMLAIDPANSSRLYLGKRGSVSSEPFGLLSSTDSGTSWTPLGSGLPAAGINSIAVDPIRSSLYAGTGAGVFRSTDLGSHWSGTAYIPMGSYVSALATVPQGGNLLFAGTGQGLFRSADGGRSWEESGLTGLLIRRIVSDPQSPSHVFAATDNGVFKTTDSGKTWNAASAGMGAYPNVVTIAIDPKTPSTLYTFDYFNWVLFKTTDGANSWRRTSLQTDVYALTIDPIDPSVIYAGRYGDFDYGKDVLLKSTDGAGSWTQKQNGLPFPGSVNAIEFDPQDHSIIYAATSDGVFKSTDGAANWTATGAAEGLRYVSGLAIDPHRSTTIYAGTYQGGVYRSTDGGATWAPFNSGLTNLGVISIAIDPTGHFLFAGTTDAGVFTYEFPAGPVDLTVGSDEATRLLMIEAQTASLNFDRVTNTGSVTSIGPFGPYSGWVARATAGSDSVRILWSNDDGSAGLSLVGQTGLAATFRYPAAPGRSAIDVSASGVNTHLLWTGADRTAVLQTIDASGNVAKTLSLGPYASWQARAISDGPDGLTRILWNKDDGTAGISVVSSNGGLTTVRYGPAAGWTALDIAVGGDGLTRVLWSSTDGRLALGILDAAERLIRYGDVKSAPSDSSPSRLGSGPDGSSRILFIGGGSRIWIMSAEGAFQNEVVLTSGD